MMMGMKHFFLHFNLKITIMVLHVTNKLFSNVQNLSKLVNKIIIHLLNKVNR